MHINVYKLILHTTLLMAHMASNILKQILKYLKSTFSMFKSKVRNFYLEKYQKILMHECRYNCIFSDMHSTAVFVVYNCFRFWVFCREISNYFFCGYNEDNEDCYCQLDVFLVSETFIVQVEFICGTLRVSILGDVFWWNLVCYHLL